MSVGLRRTVDDARGSGPLLTEAQTSTSCVWRLWWRARPLAGTGSVNLVLESWPRRSRHACSQAEALGRGVPRVSMPYRRSSLPAGVRTAAAFPHPHALLCGGPRAGPWCGRARCISPELHNMGLVGATIVRACDVAASRAVRPRRGCGSAMARDTAPRLVPLGAGGAQTRQGVPARGTGCQRVWRVCRARCLGRRGFVVQRLTTTLIKMRFTIFSLKGKRAKLQS